MSIMNLKKNENTSNIFGILSNAGRKKSSRRNRSFDENVDFFMRSAMPSVMWMQEAFKQEQR